MIKIKSDKIILFDSVFSGFVYVDGGIIREVSGEDRPWEQEYDFTGYYVSPGFVEMHTHGGGGHPFINGTIDDVIEACNFHLRHGTTTILPTITAGPFTTMEKAASDIAEAVGTGKIRANVPGVHMEGPYLSECQCGAQCPDFITVPNEREYVPFVEKYGNFIRKWTYAPEKDTDQKFVKFISGYGVIPSIGHSDAVYDDVRKAVDNGASMVTHLYSCTSSITRDHGFRKLGVTECAYLFDGLKCEIIADGKHLPKELIQLAVKDKGIDGLVMVSDSLSIAGTDVTECVMSGTEFIVEDGVCKLKDRSAFAGSVATDEVLVRNALSAGCRIYEAIRMMSYNPAEILGLNKGSIASGKDADIVVFDDDIGVKEVFVAGKRIEFSGAE